VTARIQIALDRLEQVFPDGTAEKLGILIDELERWNRKVNLTAIHDRDEIIRLHLLDSLVAAPLLEGTTVLDLGCGTGRDVYVASQLVGEGGRVIGLDMTDTQLGVARKY